MPPKSSSTSKSTQGDSRIGRSKVKSATCKTCSSCRQKKIRCSGVRPHCDECIDSDLACVYPRDARREPRPSKALFETLEATMAAMLDHMKASGTSSAALEEAIRSKLPSNQESNHDQVDQDDAPPATPESTVPVHLPTPAASATTYNETPRTIISQSDMRMHELASTYPQLRDDASALGFEHHSSFDHRSQPVSAEPPQNVTEDSNNDPPDGLSPCEARVAGVFHERGCVSSVHGLAGIMNPTRRALHKENISKVSRKGEVAVSASKARLISNAILQKQRENRLFRQPQQSIDLDGCEPDLAKHLISLHFNRHHCSNFITYRPAIMDSIARGGPWINKLLLNAIFYHSSLHSDRPGLRAPDKDPESVGRRFYERICMLLIEAISQPSVPSAVALLLTSATLVAQGKVSAGWALSGTAYRMVIDLGCHMMLGPDYQETQSESGAHMLQKDIEHEMRKRLYWGAYMTDVIQSLYLGRQCSFATTEARVPLQLLDTFEELEDWEPYVDPTEPESRPPSYEPQPVYSVSIFGANVRLMQIGALVSDLYGISTVSYKTEVVLKKKEAIEFQLNSWMSMLPDHLRFDPDGDDIPPPHQITPYTTYHTLRILLYRAFVEEGHLRRHSDTETKRLCEQECISSALIIEKHIRAYRKTFTLRRAPFLLSYAIYSAVAIILPQERSDRGHFTDLIAFFWNCLGELQHGCNSGLKKPLSVLRDMAREFQLSSKERVPANTDQTDLYSLDESFFPQLPLGPLGSEHDMYTGTPYMHDGRTLDQAGPDFGPPGLMNFLNDQEWDLSQNTLYGLFAPTQSFQ
ncbi:hypothetical protein OPT61_g6438 [Boeremia exigua]|uniref:Uncharacterized protein n=1 Tax=Boeremia exigua TaxID=749465 RepID=A0ACC2I6L4_9PLEO|nr:hypothetical protein OPT61_g6438 [Boeremia exigua]